eukprot:3868985-Rhodomonas_salina.1
MGCKDLHETGRAQANTDPPSQRHNRNATTERKADSASHRGRDRAGLRNYAGRQNTRENAMCAPRQNRDITTHSTTNARLEGSNDNINSNSNQKDVPPRSLATVNPLSTKMAAMHYQKARTVLCRIEHEPHGAPNAPSAAHAAHQLKLKKIHARIRADTQRTMNMVPERDTTCERKLSLRGANLCKGHVRAPLA